MGESWELKCKRSGCTFQHTPREWHLIQPKTEKQQQKSATFFSWLQPIISLSRTNYAECKCRSPSDGLCCRGSLEGRSFIPFSTSICPRGSCSSVAQACLCSAFSSSALPPLVVCLTVGVRGRRKQKDVEKPSCASVAQPDLCTSLCTHTQDIAACAVSPVFVRKVRARAHRSHNTCISTALLAKY